MSNGYDRIFLKGKPLYAPAVNGRNLLIEDTKRLLYTNFEILYCPARKAPVYTAVNIDGKGFVKIVRETDKWKYEARVSDSLQIGKDFYELTGAAFHRGHIVRRIDPCWGKNAAAAMEDTFHYTNACPQHKKFNPAIWLELERNILEKGAVEWDARLTVFAGPVISDMDKPYIKQVNGDWIFIPSQFWKVVYWNKADGRRAVVAFMQSQQSLIGEYLNHGYDMEKVSRDIDRHLEHLKFKDDAVYQVDLTIIEDVTGLRFDRDDVFLPQVPEKMRELRATVPKRPVAYRSLTSFVKGPVEISGLSLD
jgi:endonuclease G, mitochondrial